MLFIQFSWMEYRKELSLRIRKAAAEAAVEKAALREEGPARVLPLLLSLP